MSVDRERAAAELGTYPAFVTTAEERRRFDLCLDRASELFEEPRESGSVRQHAIAIYRSDIPTDEGAGLDPNDPATMAGTERSGMAADEQQEQGQEQEEGTQSAPDENGETGGQEQGGGESGGESGEGDEAS